MDDIGNIVYIIAVVGYLIYRVFAGKKPQQPRKAAESDEGVTIEDILKQLTQQDESNVEPEPQPEVVEDEHAGHIHNPEPFLTVDAPPKRKMEYRMSQSESALHTRVSERVGSEPAEEENDVNKVVEELSEGIDLRRAIIYQTILETPYLRHV